MSFGHRNRDGQTSNTRSHNPFVRLAHGFNDFIENYQEVRREAYRRYPNSFR
ncbi:hypothetical protein [Martelella mangrovi]|uniref:Uncharacterized protein n=1 Tax=Martelella mangrovi TaxID=1397477 RepID=A0ABV2I7V4_9HYPH|nr:hypothetical protein [uncultured Martelella sp.]